MTTIAEVRADLINVLTNIEGWSTQNPYVGDMAPHPYSFKIARPAFDPRMVLSQARASHEFTVTAYAPRVTPEVSEQAIDALCELSGDGSLIATVQNDTYWTVDIHYAQVTRCGEVQAITWIDGMDYLAAQFTIEVVW
jgi:hypothetical protein